MIVKVGRSMYSSQPLNEISPAVRPRASQKAIVGR